MDEKYTGGVYAAYAVELMLCILVRINKWDSLWLCYVNPWFRIFGEGFAGILLCEKINEVTSRIQDSSKMEWIAVIVFALFIAARNWVKLNIMSAWVQIIPMSLLLVAFRKENGSISTILKGQVFQFLGSISFELYMTHAFVYEGLPVVSGFINTSLRDWLVYHAGTRFIITFFLCILVAWFMQIIMSCATMVEKRRV